MPLSVAGDAGSVAGGEGGAGGAGGAVMFIVSLFFHNFADLHVLG